VLFGFGNGRSRSGVDDLHARCVTRHNGCMITTGFIAVLIALHRCDTTRIYGFGPSRVRRPCSKYYQGYNRSEQADMGMLKSGLAMRCEGYANYSTGCYQHNVLREAAWPETRRETVSPAVCSHK
jgi:hypothetical protein